jgi:transcription antitermination factor NusG
MSDFASARWFALQVKPRHEKSAAEALRHKGLEDFCPQYLAVRRWSDRMKRLEFPLFPRYVFCRFDLHNKLSVLTTPGVVSILGIGKSPLPVPDGEIKALQAIVQSHLPAQPWPFLQVGESVRLECGPLAGLEGILLHFKSQYRLVVSVTLLQRSVAVEIERSWVVPTCAPKFSRTLAINPGGDLNRRTRVPAPVG